MKFSGRVVQLASILLLAASLQVPATAQNGGGYYSAIVPKHPIDTKELALYDRLDEMYNSGILGPQERADLRHDLDGIQNYELRVRSSTFGIDRWAGQHLNEKLDAFTARLDARMPGV